MTACHNIIGKLRGINFPKSVAVAIDWDFQIEGFERWLDQNRDLLAFRDCVLDLSASPPQAREGMPEDSLTVRVNYDLPTSVPVLRDELMGVLTQYHPDPVRIYRVLLARSVFALHAGLRCSNYERINVCKDILLQVFVVKIPCLYLVTRRRCWIQPFYLIELKEAT